VLPCPATGRKEEKEKRKRGKEEGQKRRVSRRGRSSLPKARSKGVRAIPTKVPHLAEGMVYAEAARALGALARDPAQRTTLAAGTAIPSGAVALRCLIPPLAAAWKFEDGGGIVRAACGSGHAAAAGCATSNVPEGSPLPDIGDCSGRSFARCSLICTCKVPRILLRAMLACRMERGGAGGDVHECVPDDEELVRCLPRGPGKGPAGGDTQTLHSHCPHLLRLL
jgi:hypothetical protein